MSGTRIGIDTDDSPHLPPGEVEYAMPEETAEQDIALQEREDEAEAMRDMAGAAASWADAAGVCPARRRVRRDGPQLGAGQACADWRGPGLAQDSRQGTGDGSSGAHGRPNSWNFARLWHGVDFCLGRILRRSVTYLPCTVIQCTFSLAVQTGRQSRRDAQRDAGTSGKRFDARCRPDSAALRVAPQAPARG